MFCIFLPVCFKVVVLEVVCICTLLSIAKYLSIYRPHQQCVWVPISTQHMLYVSRLFAFLSVNCLFLPLAHFSKGLLVFDFSSLEAVY